MRARSTVTVPAPAKINLLLYVLERQSTGYHEIVSLMQMVDLQDQLSLMLQPIRYGIRIVTRNQTLPLGEDNLITRASRAFMKHYGVETGLRIQLDKKIPIGAGLGGGSSDAAATLYGLCGLHQMTPSRRELSALGRVLGSDVPFFFGGPTAWVSGIGDRIDPASLGENLWAVLANPGFEVSTAWVYSELDRARTGGLTQPATFLKKIGLTLDQNRNKISSRASKAFPLTKRSFPLHNDLEVITIRRYPVIETMKERLCSLGAKEALMSGSGPTVFGLFPDRLTAHAAAVVLRQDAEKGWGLRHGGWTIWVTRLLNRSLW
ncbi:MAG TPA: 4-(cytidine 5'-diphospho)-2-C-methyl-D-erythritol kinase [Nitrospiria bacterium]|nr:4-(cytidine 5'-diphospho)-2-C-methyl-D-erythritol kinase [Nitrospiria bacterium]